MDPKSPTEKATDLLGPLRVGCVLGNRYRIERPIGEGGFGIVYLAHDQQLHGKPVVVKFLAGRGNQSEWRQAKFRKECEALARIEHPGVVGVLDQGTTSEGALFLVMQFVDGVALRSALLRGPLELSRAASLLDQIADALSAAHDQGVCHCDLKPENIMLRKLSGEREQAVIIDFGIAAVANSDISSSSHAKVAGSLPYMAPEQLNGKPEAASDIFSLGVIAYEMVTGQRPFQASLPVELYLQQQRGPQEKPSRLCPRLSTASERAILRSLSFETSDRYTRAVEFGEDFGRGLGETPVHAKTRPLLPGREPTKKKICLLGSSAVGKTSLIRRFVDDFFSDSYLTTIGVRIEQKEVTVGAVKVALMLWDMEGEEGGARLRVSHLRGASGLIIVADGCRSESLDAALDLRQRVLAETGPIPIVLAINKVDLHAEWEVDMAMLETLGRTGLVTFTTSAKTGKGVEQLFLHLARQMLLERERQC